MSCLILIFEVFLKSFKKKDIYCIMKNKLKFNFEEHGEQSMFSILPGIEGENS